MDTSTNGAAAESPTAANAAVRETFDTGMTRPLTWRRKQLRALRRLIRENRDDLEEALHQDLGKHPLEGHVTEISIVEKEIAQTLRHLKRWTRPRRARLSLQVQPASGRVIREPLGSVLVIAPWNYPVQLLLMPLVGAVSAGNAVVLKPSELAPATSHLFAALVPRYLDTRAIRVVEGAVPETTELLACPWDHIFYTGSGTVGRVVLEAAAKHLTPVTLELGGKSPFWVDDTSDLDEAAQWLAWGKYLNAGQTCIAPDYVLTTPDVAPRLTAALKREIAALYTDRPQESPDFGRIVNSRQFDRLVTLIDPDRTVIGGDVDRDALYIAPTVLSGVTVDDPVMQDEIFGPVLPIVTVQDHDEAIALINSRPKPLAMYIFTGSTKVEKEFVGRTSSGSICSNVALVQIAEEHLPFGGVGASGMGAYHGERSLVLFSHERAWLRKLRGPNLTAIAHAPYTRRKDRLLRR